MDLLPFVVIKQGKLFASDGKTPTTIADLMGVKPDDHGKHSGSIIFIDDKGGTSDGEYFTHPATPRKRNRVTVYHRSVMFGRLIGLDASVGLPNERR